MATPDKINGIYWEHNKAPSTVKRLRLIIKSKLGKNKRHRHITQLENSLGLTEAKTESNICDPSTTDLKERYRTHIYNSAADIRRFFDGAAFEVGMEGIEPATVEQYKIINHAFNPEYRVELSTLHGTPYAVIRTIEGAIRTHIYLTMDYSTLVIYGDVDEFFETGEKLEARGYVVKYGQENCYEFQLNPF